MNNPHSLTPSQVEGLLSHLCHDPALIDAYDTVSIILGTGIRPGELADLSWMDVDLATREMTVGGIKAPRRRIPFSTAVAQQLASRRDRQGATSELVMGRHAHAALRRVSRILNELAAVIEAD
jgi:integrase